jgi:NADH-quinone oxidoreductase subunit E
VSSSNAAKPSGSAKPSPAGFAGAGGAKPPPAGFAAGSRAPTAKAPAPAGPPKPIDFPPADVREECERIVARYPERMAALLPILHVAQRRYGGWVSPEVEAGVAKYLGVSDGHVRGVLTFYAMFNVQPVGRHTVWVCRTLSCALRGAKDLTKAACAKAGVAKPGASSADGRFFVREMECLGLCEVAPAVWVDGEVHGNVTPEALGALMDRCT